MFAHLKEWGREHPIIFCGYEIADPNIQYILFDLGDRGVLRPMYALVKPSLDELDEVVWRGRRFETVKADFESFLKYLDNTIPSHARTLSGLRETDQLPIARWFTSQLKPSEDLVAYLDAEIEYIFKGIPVEGVSPHKFYRGLTHSWEIFLQDLDVRRRVTDDILFWMLDETDSKSVRCFLLKGHAGSGKNITLRRAAWEAACEHDQFILYLKEGGVIRKELLYELYTLTGRRLTLFISDITKVLPETLDLIKFSKRQGMQLNLLFGARTNEWNVYGGELAPEIDRENDLRNLSEKEVGQLLAKLEQHSCLGHLKTLNQQQRLDAFRLTAERQLLVALYEATSGKSFEELVFDEYKNIVPEEARILYLDICTLHRLGVSVRAGLISRISGISFEKFRESLLEPLEHVVRYFNDRATRDFAYRSRHPLIAKFVFQQALKRPGDRADQIIRILRYLNVDYQGDEEAFGQLIRGKELAEMFADRSLADQIYKVAEETGANIAHIGHQRAIFELNHPNGSTRRAMDALREAEKHAKKGLEAIAHTRAMVLRKMAIEAVSPLERKKYRSDAEEILRQQLQRAQDAYPFHGLGEVLLDELRDKLRELRSGGQEDQPEDRLGKKVVTDLIGQTEEVISRGLQKFPNDEYLLSLQASFSTLLQNEPRAVQALETAFKANPRSDVVATRLAQHYLRDGRRNEAESVLKKCLENNGGSKRTHLQLAKIYLENDEEVYKTDISYHLKRSFTEGDTNYDAQALYARHEFLYGEKSEAERTFKSLSAQTFAPQFRNQYGGEVRIADGSLVEYRGQVNRLHDSYCFVGVPALGTTIFVHYSQFNQREWESLTSGTSIRSNLAFNVHGACGINAKISR